MHIFCNHYRAEEALISTLEQEVEFQDFFCTFNEVNKELNDKAKKQPQQKVLKGEIKQKDMIYPGI